MNSSTVNEPRALWASWLGLFIALFGIFVIRWGVTVFYSEFSFLATLWKESLIWLCVIALLFIMRKGECMPIRSIGVGTAAAKSSVLWGVILALLCGMVGAVVVSLTHFNGGQTGAALAKLPVWLVFLVVVRAGIVEELFYRGYAIERLQVLGLNRWWAGIIPLSIFGLGHAANGWANVILALALGAILTAFYLWRRDLVANMIGHFVVDFISVLLPRFLAHG